MILIRSRSKNTKPGEIDGLRISADFCAADTTKSSIIVFFDSSSEISPICISSESAKCLIDSISEITELEFFKDCCYVFDKEDWYETLNNALKRCKTDYPKSIRDIKRLSESILDNAAKITLLNQSSAFDTSQPLL